MPLTYARPSRVAAKNKSPTVYWIIKYRLAAKTEMRPLGSGLFLVRAKVRFNVQLLLVENIRLTDASV